MAHPNPTLLLLFAIPSVCAQPPVFHWPLDESSGSVAHAWGGSNGTLVGGTTWDPTGGHHQGASRFDGVDDRILLGSCDLTTGTGLSISLWTKADFVTGMDRTLIAKTVGPLLDDHVWSVAFVSASALRFRLKTGGTTTELTTPPSSLFGGAWYHIVATYDGSEMRLILNGSLMASTAKSGLIGYHPQAPGSLGAVSTGTQPYSGWIDDVRIYDRALSDAEVLDLLMGAMTTDVEEPAVGTSVIALLREAQPTDRLIVRDPLGRIERTSSITLAREADLDGLPSGIHLLSLEGHDTRHTARVVIP